MAAPLELGRLYQLGYVTSDMAQAIDYAERMFGVAGFRDYGELESEVAAGRARIRVAQGAIGGTVFELIEPLGGADKVYRDHLPARGFAIRLHHLAYYLDDPEAWRRFNRAVDALGITVAIRGTSPSSEYVYVDLRSELGHYAEVVHRFGAGSRRRGGATASRAGDSPNARWWPGPIFRWTSVTPPLDNGLVAKLPMKERTGEDFSLL